MNTIDLSPFVSKDESRPSICAPFSIGEWTYATDGRILIRVPRREDVPENPSAPQKATTLIPTDVGPFVPLPEFEEYPLHLLDNEKECQACEGHGYIACPTCGNEERCEVCYGSGMLDNAPPYVAVQIGEHHFSNHYLTLLKGLPNVKIAVNEKEESPAAFQFDGGAGCLMPMRR